MMNHRSIVLLYLALIIATCASCAGPQPQPSNPVVGHWQGKSGVLDVTITLHPDGTCEGLEKGITKLGRWQQKGASVIIALEGDVFYGGLISRREMLITRESTGRTITLTKARQRQQGPKQ